MEKKIHHANSNCKQLEMAILIADKIGFKNKFWKMGETTQGESRAREEERAWVELWQFSSSLEVGEREGSSEKETPNL